MVAKDPDAKIEDLIGLILRQLHKAELDYDE
jgi:hypothetical protein